VCRIEPIKAVKNPLKTKTFGSAHRVQNICNLGGIGMWGASLTYQVILISHLVLHLARPFIDECRASPW
jgi:hypothetical protein